MDYKLSYQIQQIGLIAFLIIAAIAYVSSSIVWAIIGSIVLLATLIQALIFLRCPECGKLINDRQGKPNFCAHCGAAFDWD